MTSHLVSFVTTDICAITRGRAFSAERCASQLEKGCGWVPANIALTPFDIIADDNPYGSAGDLRLMPDVRAHTDICNVAGLPKLSFYQGDLQELDGSPWEGCVRSMLKNASSDLERKYGLRVIAAFEHEFSLTGEALDSGPSFSITSLRASGGFPAMLWAALEESGLEPECFLPEYGARQYELVNAPAPALEAADRATALRIITREVARANGMRAIFSPKTAPDAVGNGVHIHLSFTDIEGNSVTFDAERPGRLSAIASRFASGILRHMPALTALCAPSVVSYQRLKPHNWSAAWTTLGEKDREATLRICPTPSKPDYDPSRAFNMEFRAADATASPHLSLFALIRAGMEGLENGTDLPPITKGDPETLDAKTRMDNGISRLPSSLPQALEALEADETVMGWFHQNFKKAYLAMRRKEIQLTAGLDDWAICERYSRIY
ncbi:glutamine synthetase family protein [Brucella oryzae]|uniref:Glutamine synthetase n=1 Tax=Brucella oryzae TaxID=335286 RepID=A0A2S7IWM0_9HYPH|nr:glutamine synthetase family protein [Brucella oryzae]PQA72402.1 glutamine synthetase [Brucella oryzae]